MGGKIPKQFMELNGKPVIVRTIETFLSHPKIDCVIVGINPDWHDYMSEISDRFFSGKKVFITDGGKDRNDTIMNIISFAKNTLKKNADDIILTHDAVRPFVSSRIIDDSISAMEKYPICTAAVSATDTIIVSEDGICASDFPVRSTMFQVQTPQTFHMGDFENVYGNLSDDEKKNITDACKLFHMKGYDVKIIDGDRNNIKLTYPSDFTIAQSIINTEVTQ